MTLPVIARIERFGLNSNDAARLKDFYVRAFGCRDLGQDRLQGAAFESLMGLGGGARRDRLRLGRQIIEILEFDVRGAPYPAEAAATDVFFQHFAIVVRNMDQAMGALAQVGGWTAISREGAQLLPASAGGVRAFKFRDPDGHPLEFLQFPETAVGVPRYWQAAAGAECFLGVDHSALAVTDASKSTHFYERLGLRLTARGVNAGAAQERLDAVAEAEVDVIALSPQEPTPHVELLHYRGARLRALPVRVNDVAATRLICRCLPHAMGAAEAVGAADLSGVAGGGVAPDEQLLVDADGHRLHLLGAPLRTPAALGGSSHGASGGASDGRRELGAE